MKPKKSLSKPATDRIRQVCVWDVIPCPENEQLYRPVDRNDPAVVALAESIRRNGLREPLVITADNYILSGHRRHIAAQLAGLVEISCRIDPIRYADADRSEILKRLREHNLQRVKGLDELLREEVVSADPDLAYEALIEHRQKNSDLSEFCDGIIELSGTKDRCVISDRKREMLMAAIRVINGWRQFWPLSLRGVHYGLLNNLPLQNTLRQASRYANTVKCYKDLSNLLLRARLVGKIPWNAIDDETRPVTHWNCHVNAQDFMRQEVDGLFKGYFRNLQQSQPDHIEIFGEKLTVKKIIEQVAGRYRVPVTIGRGNCSGPPRYGMAQRFKKSGKKKLIVLLLSDFDPDGESIVESFARSMRDDFDVKSVVPYKVALTAEQVEELQLQPQMQAKESSSHYDKFTGRHGTDVFELEAVSPKTLQRLLTEAIDAVLDVDAFNAEIDLERRDAACLEEARQRAFLALEDMWKEAG